MKSVNKTAKINTNVMENNETTTNNGRNKCTARKINVENNLKLHHLNVGERKETCGF